MRKVLLTNENNYVGRQYMSTLSEMDDLDVIVIGNYPVHNEIEDKRCANLWNPPLIDDIPLKYAKVYRFNSLNNLELLDFLKEHKYDLAIQGGTGIIKKSLIECFRYGILNFHPGDLPSFRGCSAPEWQLLENKPVICTCHLIDEGIDTGQIYRKRIIFESSVKNYHKMRSLLYYRISLFVFDVLSEIDESFLEKCVPQDENKAQYRNYIGDENIEKLINLMKE